MEKADSALKIHRNDAAAWALKGDVQRCTVKTKKPFAATISRSCIEPNWPEVQVDPGRNCIV